MATSSISPSYFAFKPISQMRLSWWMKSDPLTFCKRRYSSYQLTSYCSPINSRILRVNSSRLTSSFPSQITSINRSKLGSDRKKGCSLKIFSIYSRSIFSVSFSSIRFCSSSKVLPKYLSLQKRVLRTTSRSARRVIEFFLISALSLSSFYLADVLILCPLFLRLSSCRPYLLSACRSPVISATPCTVTLRLLFLAKVLYSTPRVTLLILGDIFWDIWPDYRLGKLQSEFLSVSSIFNFKG